MCIRDRKLSLLDLFMGVHGGVLGETCALAILLGLVYLCLLYTSRCV